MSVQTPLIRLVDPFSSPTRVRQTFEEIQDVMGVPWIPASWRAYASTPSVLELFWSRLRPQVETREFLRRSIELLDMVFEAVPRWFRPKKPRVTPKDRARIRYELDAFAFGNAQVLLQQIALDRVLAEEAVGCEGAIAPRGGRSVYRRPEMMLVNEAHASPEVLRIYDEVLATPGVPVVSSVYKGVAKWPRFLEDAWESLKECREHLEYFELCGTLAHHAEAMIRTISPAISLGARELKLAVGDDADAIDNVRRTVQSFTALMPSVVLNDAIMRLCVERHARPLREPPRDQISA